MERIESTNMPVELFVTHETPHACWDVDMESRNLTFLDRLDPNQFSFLASILGPQLEDDDNKQRAALQIRSEYAHALETFFALLGALVQAPHCVYGWMLSYTNKELIDLTNKITNRQPVKTRLNIDERVSWEAISRCVCMLLPENRPDKKHAEHHFALFWGRLAADFVNNKRRNEYNSIKHGFRAQAGGFHLRIKPSDSPKDDPPVSLGGSEYGSRFYVRERLLDDRINFEIADSSVNWNPRGLLSAIELIAVSIENVVVFLKYVNGDRENQHFLTMPEEDAFLAPWASPPGTTDAIIRRNVHVSPENLYTREDVLRSY